MPAKPFLPVPKPTLSRLRAKAAKIKVDLRTLETWRYEVRARDQMRCRCCGVKVIRLPLQVLHPRRAEVHHLAGRTDEATRSDTRCGVLLCRLCHDRVTGKVNDKVHIDGTVWFVLAGRRYVNADYPVQFTRVA